MKIFYQSAFEKWPFEDESIQVIITSPPYYALRKYNIPNVVIGGDKNCQHKWITSEIKKSRAKTGMAAEKTKDGQGGWQHESNFCIHCQAFIGQHGLEPTPKLYLEHCMLWIKEAWRVLSDDGCLFINIADSYNNKSICIGRQDKSKYGGKSGLHCLRGGTKDLPHKTKLLIPERLMVMMQDDGWIIRNHIVWHKTNGLPESVKDRFSRRWETIILATKSPYYQFFLDNVREPYKVESIKRMRYTENVGKYETSNEHNPQSLRQFRAKFNNRVRDVKKSRIKGPMYRASEKEIAEYDLNAETEYNLLAKNPGDVWEIANETLSLKHYAIFPQKLAERMILCSTKPGDIVLDPFCGSGTTLRVAERLNRIGYGIDLGYGEVQKERLSNIQKVLYDF